MQNPNNAKCVNSKVNYSPVFFAISRSYWNLYQNFIKNDNRFTTMLLNHEAGFMISLFKKVFDF